MDQDVSVCPVERKCAEVVVMKTRRQTRRPSHAAATRYLDTVAVAELINKSTKAVYHMVGRGTIPYIKKGVRLFFDLRQIEAWMRQGTVVSA